VFVVIGTTTVDLIVQGIPGHTALGDGFRADNLVFCQKPLLMLMGGNGGNSATVLGRLGVETAVCSSVGQDDLGDWLAGKLAAVGVSLDGLVRQPGLATSSSTILLSSAESQAVFHHKGATDGLAVTAAHQSLYAQAEVLLASSYSLFPKMRAGGFAKAIGLSYEAGGMTAIDIGPAIGEPVRIQEIAPLFQQLDFLIGNTHELAVCAGAADWEAAVTILLAEGCRCVVIKRGAGGSALRTRELHLDVAAFPVAADISVGAGDAFNAGFLYSLWASRSLGESNEGAEPVQGSDHSAARTGRTAKERGSGRQALHQRHTLLEALRFGNAVATLVLGGEQGVSGAPTLAGVERFLQD
jgi:fructokinase